MTPRPPALLRTLAVGALLWSLAVASSAEEYQAPPGLAACLESDATNAPEESRALCRAAEAEVSTDEERAMVHLWLALGAMAKGDRDGAMAAADQAVGFDANAETVAIQAQTRWDAGRYEEALTLANQGLRPFPRSDALERTRLLSLSNLGRAGEAIAGMERLHRRTPADVDLTLALVGALDDAGEVRRRDAHLERAIRAKPDSVDMRLVRAVWTMRLRPAETLADLDVVIAQAPEADAYALRSYARLVAGDRAGAGEDLEAVADVGDLGAVAAMYASFAAEALDQPDRAFAFADHLVSISHPSDLAPALARRGNLLAARGEVQPAKADFERAALLDPEEDAAWAGLGSLSLATDPDQSRIYYERALKLDPDSAAYAYGLTEAQFWSGDYPAAEAGYLRLLKAYPDDPELYASLAATRSRSERFDEALAPAARAVALAPDHPDYLIIHGEALFMVGDEAAALQVMDRLTALQADTAYSRYIAALIHRRDGAFEAALREVEAGLALAPDDADLTQEKGIIYYTLDDPLSAREWLDKALALNPQSADALFVRALARGEIGDTEGAAADRAAALALDPSLGHEP